MPIRFFYEGIDFKVSKPRKTVKWINETFKREGKKIGEINYIFCDDRYLFQLNKQFLNHHDLTDVITFDYSDHRIFSAEIYISVERVMENSKKLKTHFQQEILRVMIHGVLHILGYKDKTSVHIKVMRNKEEAYLSLW